ncbi:MAG TPA: MFS transporter, partial [Streptosporangiaceae bacterium]|nr:MFS transporter [Streptosporangiaceae bacterium]
MGAAGGTRKPFSKVFVDTSWRNLSLRGASQAGLVNNLNDGLTWGVFPLFFASRGLGLTAIGLIKGVYPLLWGAGQLLTGRLSDTLGRKPLIVAGMLVQAAAFPAALMLPSRPLVAGLVSAALLGAGTAMVYPGADRLGGRPHPPVVAGAGTWGIPVLARPRLRHGRGDRRAGRQGVRPQRGRGSGRGAHPALRAPGGPVDRRRLQPAGTRCCPDQAAGRRCGRWRRCGPVEGRSVSPETLAAQALGEVDPVSGGLAPVIHPSTNYEQQADGSYRQDRQYTRADNPTFEHAERLLAALEGAGCACALFASGMAAATAVFQSLLPGDHVLVSRVLYWGVRKWLAEFALSWGLDVEFTDTSDLAAVGSAIRPGRTRLIWVETPANPMWEITDLAALCELAHSAGVRVAVYNTVATPVLTRPLELGADLVV